jgi:hypothetical protein
MAASVAHGPSYGNNPCLPPSGLKFPVFDFMISGLRFQVSAFDFVISAFENVIMPAFALQLSV